VDRSTDDDATRHWRTWYRRAEPKRAVGTIVVVVAHELGEHREQMPLIQHDDVVKTFCVVPRHSTNQLPDF
jgi:hypothetical protein